MVLLKALVSQAALARLAVGHSTRTIMMCVAQVPRDLLGTARRCCTLQPPGASLEGAVKGFVGACAWLLPWTVMKGGLGEPAGAPPT